MSGRVFLSGADIVLPDRIESGQTLVIEDGRIADLVSGPRAIGDDELLVQVPGAIIVPGFVDVHVHGVEGLDVLDGADALAGVASRLPQVRRHGVLPDIDRVCAGCPDHVSWRGVRGEELRSCWRARAPGASREQLHQPWRTAAHSPRQCLRSPARAIAGASRGRWILRRRDSGGDRTVPGRRHRHNGAGARGRSGARQAAGRPRGIRVSLGHSGATFDQAQAAITAGARHATHLFNRMPPMTHRDPGLAGAVVASEDVAAEIVCDGHHVHQAFVRMAMAAKGRGRVMAITDGTAGSGLPPGARRVLGGRKITVREVARLDDGTTAGSVATMDRRVRLACERLRLRCPGGRCSSAPRRRPGRWDSWGMASFRAGAVADLAVLDRNFAVLQTWVGGSPAWTGTSVPRTPSPLS